MEFVPAWIGRQAQAHVMAHLKQPILMKTTLFKKSGFLIFIIFMLSMTSCQIQSSTIPYNVEQSYIFKVTVKDLNSTLLQTDTLTMIIKNKGLIGGILGMNMAEWKSRTFTNNDQKRGINIETDLVEIQMPINYNFLENENLVIAGYPSFSKSMLFGYTSESEHQFVKGYGKLSGKKLKQYKAVTDSSTIQFKNEILSCKVAEYKNLSSIEEYGLYELKTFYNEKYGFLKMLYKYPNGKNVVFELIEIKNEP